MTKGRIFCTRTNCKTVTCGRHRCKVPKWYDKPIDWMYYEDCEMYTGVDKIPKRRKKLEEDID